MPPGTPFTGAKYLYIQRQYLHIQARESDGTRVGSVCWKAGWAARRMGWRRPPSDPGACGHAHAAWAGSNSSTGWN